MARRKGGSFDKTFLEELGENATKAAIEALENGAKLVVADAKSRVKIKSGKLKDSIHYEIQNGGKRIKIVADAKNKNGVPYGPFVEFVHNEPFLYPAMDAKRAEIKQMVIDAIKGACRDAKH